MGMFDYFEGTCPKCGVLTTVQTKIGPCALLGFREGDRTPIPMTGGMLMQYGCNACGQGLVVEMEMGRFIRFADADLVDPYFLEGEDDALYADDFPRLHQQWFGGPWGGMPMHVRTPRKYRHLTDGAAEPQKDDTE
jgi:hypothetical protein